MRILSVILALFTALGLAASGVSRAQEPPAASMSMADLEEMLGPIALYPDNLLANVLAASVYPDEIMEADKLVKGGAKADAIDQQTWEPPVKSIAKVPEVLDFLVDNIDWTTAIGEVYITQSQDVMTAVQNLRAKAKKNGALESSEQMTVVEEGSTIVIEQPSPEVVYVPQYNPQVVYVDDDDDLDGAIVGGMIGFGVGLACSEIWDDCDWDCDWDNDCVGWGNNDVDIERNTNIETGDINIGSGNEINRGDRTNVKGGDRTTNNIGREGQKWQPNQQKVQERQSKSGGQRASDQFRGASNKSSPSRTKVPTRTSASTNRTPAKPLSAGGSKPALTQPKAGNRGASAGKPAPRAATNTPPSRPAPKTSAPRPKPKTPSAAPRPKTSNNKPSGFSPSRGSSKASSRGASSRSSGSRSGGGGASRGGGGRGGGGGGRR
jgi:hypothetical protein